MVIETEKEFKNTKDKQHQLKKQIDEVKQEKDALKKMELDEKTQDSKNYSYFPFTHGDHIER